MRFGSSSGSEEDQAPTGSKDGAASFLKQYTHDVYSSISDQLKRQAATALPDIALQYLQAHAQRGDDAAREARCYPSMDWVEVEHLRIESEVDEDGWALLSADDEALVQVTLGLRVLGRRRGGVGASILLTGVRAGLVTVPLAVGGAAWKAGTAAGGLGLQLAGLGSRPPFPSIGVPPWDRFVEESVYVARTEWACRVWLPFESALDGPDARPPVVLLLHGYRECGWDNYWQCSSGLGNLLQEWGFAESFPAVVVLPQLPRKPWDVKWWEGWKERAVQDAVMAMLRHAVRKYHCDGRRVYVIGESLGGEGAWQLAACFPRAFAGVAASCGSLEPYDWNEWEWGSDPDVYRQVAGSMRAPVWFCHGSEDPYVPLGHARQLETALGRARGRGSWLGLPLRMIGWRSTKEVVFKTYEGMGHEVWDRAYQEDDMLEWIFKQRL